ncbi:hypothetical protein MCGE09_00657 [Thaumarchaeota archaeon SCGC AB-539-E09]|nr:hypothetical protein MCGE09_00657 [Thaumarchaeota archaeon SCGC AB-539-E09]
MTDLMVFMEEVVLICVAFLLFIMYLFYVRYPVNRETDNEKRARNLFAVMRPFQWCSACASRS